MDWLTQEITWQGSTNSVLLKVLLNALAIFAAAYLLRGVHLKNLGQAILAAIFLAILHATLGKILLFLAIPLRLLTLGLFNLVIDAALIMLAAYFLPGFSVKNFGWALLLALVLTLFNGVLHLIYLG
ncbi:MAG: phage holin family protein [Lewinellaceae bacterium]|nr:phage holin family protein [Lewinellaceae bacterium]